MHFISDGEEALTVMCDRPFINSDGAELFFENRTAVRGLAWGKHRVVLRALGAPVKVLGLFGYDTRDTVGQ